MEYKFLDSGRASVYSVWWVVGSIPSGVPIEIFFDSASGKDVACVISVE